MGRLNDKMTQLADKIRSKTFLYPYRMSIDKMIELIDDLEYAVWTGNALPSDVSAGMTFNSYASDKLQTGTMPDTAASVDKNIVTIPAGRIREDTTVTIPSGSVTIDEEQNKIIVTEGYVQEEEIDLPGGGDFYQCAAVYGPRKVDGFIVSGAGNSAVNGNYLPTDLRTEEDTPIYKHEKAEYYYVEMYGEKGICTTPDSYPGNGIYYAYDWDGGEWMAGSGGTEPVPTVTAGQIIVDADVPKTWDGTRLKFSNGMWLPDKSVSGLRYQDTLVPVVGSVYDTECSVRSQYACVEHGGESCILPLTQLSEKALTGQQITYTYADNDKGNIVVDSGSVNIKNDRSFIETLLQLSSGAVTVTFWVKNYSADFSAFSFLGNDGKYLTFRRPYGDDCRIECNGNETSISCPKPSRDKWRHYAVVINSKQAKVYCDGVFVGDGTVNGFDSFTEFGQVRLLGRHNNAIRDFRVYSKEITANEIAAISLENDPTR